MIRYELSYTCHEEISFFSSYLGYLPPNLFMGEGALYFFPQLS